MMLLLSALVLFPAFCRARAAVFTDGQIQPGVYPAPVLPSNFTKSSDFWRSPAAAPKLKPRQQGGFSSRKTGKEPTSQIGPRQSGKAWSEWQDIRYMFTLYVLFETTSAKDSLANTLKAVTPTRPLVSIITGPNRIQKTRSEIRHTLDSHRQTVQTTWTS